MALLGDYFFGGEFELVNSYANRKIPNLDMEISKSEEDYIAYNNGIFLSNFDSVINTYFADIIDVNFNYFNDLTSPGIDDKYKIKIIGLKTKYFKNDSHETESSENSEGKLTSLVINSIKAYDKNNKWTQGYLETKDFYLFAAQLSNFELLYGNALRKDKTNGFNYFNVNPVNSLKWYIKQIVDAVNNKPGSIKDLKTHFRANYNFILSLNNFLNNPDLNIISKEENSQKSVIALLSQVINNNFGASYFRYNNGKFVIQEMFKQDFNNIHLNNTLLNKFKKNARNTKFYDLTNKEESDKFNDLFKDLIKTDDVLTISNKDKQK
jgi:hypothetical protein